MTHVIPYIGEKKYTVNWFKTSIRETNALTDAYPQRSQPKLNIPHVGTKLWFVKLVALHGEDDK